MNKVRCARAIVERDRLREWDKCFRNGLDGFLYWLKNYVWTFDEHDHVNPIKPFPFERQYLQVLCRTLFYDPLLVIEKSRQMLVSWAVNAFLAWRIQAYEAQRIFLQSKKEDDADALLTRSKFIFKRQPEWMKERAMRGDEKYQSIRYHLILPNMSNIWAVPQGGDQVRQYVGSVWVADEWSVQDQAGASWDAGKPTIDGGGRFVGIGTPAPGFMRDFIQDKLEDIFMTGTPDIIPDKVAEELSGLNPNVRDFLNSTAQNDWGAGRPTKGAKRIIPGVWIRKNRSGLTILRIHYSADPEKATEKWQTETLKGVPGGAAGRRWKREREIDWDAGSGKRIYEQFENRHPWVIKPFPIIQDEKKDPNDSRLQQINPDGKWNFFGGMDYGRANPTCHIWLAVAPEREYNGVMIARKYIFREYYAKEKNVPTYAREILEIDVDSDGHPLDVQFRAIDPRTADEREKDVDTEFDRFNQAGLFVLKAARTDAGIDLINTWLTPREELDNEPELQVFDTCPIIISEFLNYIYEDWADASTIKNPKEKPMKAFDHGMNSLKYLANENPFPPRIIKQPLQVYKSSSGRAY